MKKSFLNLVKMSCGGSVFALKSRSRFSAAFLAIMVFCAAVPSVAHHAITSTYDVNKTTKVQGVVTGFRFKNPHVGVYFDVANDDGSTTSWVADGSAATILRREGWTPDTLKAGDRIQIIGEGTHDGSPQVMMRSVSVLNDDGSIASEIFGSVEDFSVTYDAQIVERPLRREDGVPNFSGIWTGQGSPVHPPGGEKPSYNDIGEVVHAAYELVDDHQVFCDAPGIVRQGGMTPHGVRITQYEDRVVFDYEEYGVTNIAYFDPADATTGFKTHMGDSVARYEDGALIVETTNLLSEQSHAGGSRLSDEVRVIQTYQRVDEPEGSALMHIHTRAIDPAYLTEDFEINNLKIASVEYEFIENGCEAPLRERRTVHPAMSFFLTSVGPGDGANLGGLSGADAHCAALAENVGQGDKNWRAYLSTTGDDGVNARDRIGPGPWYNARGDVISVDLDDLHGEALGITRESVVSERAGRINARGDDPNRHDILTGSLADGTASTGENDSTCSNWNGNAEGSALVGHFDRQGGGQNSTSWNSAHSSRGCSQADLQGSGGDGLFYCFAVEAD